MLKLSIEDQGDGLEYWAVKFEGERETYTDDIRGRLNAALTAYRASLPAAESDPKESSLAESLRDVLAGIEDGRVPDGVVKEGWRVLKEYERMTQ